MTTSKTLDLPTRQDLFNHAVGGIIEQGRLSFAVSPSGSAHCKYRAPASKDCDGSIACVIGQLITDEAHDKYPVEGHGLRYESVRAAVEESIRRPLIGDDLHFLRGLQAAHDAVAQDREEYGYAHDGKVLSAVEEFVRRANLTAEQYGLVPFGCLCYR